MATQSLVEGARGQRRLSIPEVAKDMPLEAIIDSIDLHFERFCAVLREDEARLGHPVDTALDLSEQSVKFRAAVRPLKEPFGMARSFMENTLRKNTAGRPELLLALGDCSKIAHIQQVLVKLKEILPLSEDAKDDRLTRCAEACANVEAVLQERGLGAKLREMMEAERKKVEATLHAPSPLPAQAGLERMSTDARQALLAEIDDLVDEDSTREEALGKLDLLFESYTDGFGFLQGPAYDLVVTDLSRYVRKEWDARNERLREEGKVEVAEMYEKQMTEEKIRQWVAETICLGSDGCITKSEALEGFIKCVNEIDPPRKASY